MAFLSVVMVCSCHTLGPFISGGDLTEPWEEGAWELTLVSLSVSDSTGIEMEDFSDTKSVRMSVL